MIILRNNSHGGIIRVCMGIFTTALRNKKIRQILKKKYLTLLPQRIACYLTAYFDEKNPFWRVVHFGVFYVHKKSPYVHKKRGDETSDNPCNYFSNRYLCGWYSTFQWIGKLRPKSFTRRSFTITWFSVTIRFENLIDRKKSNHRVAIRLLALNETSWDPLYNRRRDSCLSGKSIYAAMKCNVLRLQMTHFDTFLNSVLPCAI